MSTVYYPRLVKRVRATLIDSVLVVYVALASLVIGVSLGVENTLAKLGLVIIPILILEPALVAWTGGTVGHHLNRIKIVKKAGVGRIGFFAATLRFLIKALFGWFSLIFILTTRKYQALHDIAAGSVVVHKDVNGLPEYEVLAERKPEDAGDRLPSIPRRLGIIFLYLVFSTLSLSFLSAMFLSRACVYAQRCNQSDRVAAILIDVFWLVALATSIVLGWRGRLYGARRQPTTPR